MSYIDIRDRSQHTSPGEYRYDIAFLKKIGQGFVNKIYKGDSIHIKASSGVDSGNGYELKVSLEHGVTRLYNEHSNIEISVDSCHYGSLKRFRYFVVGREPSGYAIVDGRDDENKGTIVQYEMEKWTEKKIKEIDDKLEDDRFKSGQEFQELLSDL
jgi:hypothetical protein